jgi:hypothetical protein
MNDKPRSSNGYTGEDLARVHATCLYVATALEDFLQPWPIGARGIP